MIQLNWKMIRNWHPEVMSRRQNFVSVENLQQGPGKDLQYFVVCFNMFHFWVPLCKTHTAANHKSHLKYFFTHFYTRKSEYFFFYDHEEFYGFLHGFVQHGEFEGIFLLSLVQFFELLANDINS